jgi:F-type H+-transporting ATPase subunit delta
MAAGTVAGVYATALLELAHERGSYEAVVAGCRTLQADFPAQALADLDDPRVGKVRAKDCLRGMLKDQPKELVDFFQLLVDRDRLRDARAIVEQVDDLDDAAKGVTEVYLHVAASLGEHARERLERSLKGRYGDKYELLTSIDPELVAGFTLRVGDRFIDASSRRKFNEMRAAMLAAPLNDDQLWVGAA